MTDAANGLLLLLRRHPWLSRSDLEAIYGSRVDDLLSRHEASLAIQDFSGVGLCYASKGISLDSVVSRSRWAAARKFVCDKFGATALLVGLSPGPVADYEMQMEGSWVRVWVDLGVCAPEALGFVRHPPEHYGAYTRDYIVVLDPARMDAVSSQVSDAFRRGHSVTVVCDGSVRNILTPASNKGVWLGYTPEQIREFLNGWRLNDERVQGIGRISARMDDLDWWILATLGNMPLLTPRELAFLYSDDGEQYHQAMRRIEKLTSLHMLVNVYRPDGARLVISWRSFELLVKRWGSAVEDIMKFHPWPHRLDDRGKLAYSTKWSSRFYQHLALSRKFVLALMAGARRVTNSFGGVDLSGSVLIGPRLAYQENGSKELRWVVPDGVTRVLVWRKAWINGNMGNKTRVSDHTLLLEIDRATNPLTRLSERLDRYAQVWPSLSGGQSKPLLVWIIDGAPSRERAVLDKMIERRLSGWTITLGRLVLPQADPWWTIWAERGLEIGYDDMGGFAPWRCVWHSTDGEKGRLLPFLGSEPWVTKQRYV